LGREPPAAVRVPLKGRSRGESRETYTLPSRAWPAGLVAVGFAAPAIVKTRGGEVHPTGMGGWYRMGRVVEEGLHDAEPSDSQAVLR
jgi:hypothetical protein